MSARAALAAALGRRDAAARGDLAAALRPSLVVGEPCPVCTQHVPALPPPLPGADVAALEAAVARAQAGLERALATEADAVAAERHVAGERDRLTAEITRLRAAVAAADRAFDGAWAPADVDGTAAGTDGAARTGHARGEASANTRGARLDSVGAVEAVLKELDALGAAAAAADDAVRAARRTRDQAAAEAAAIQRELASAAGALRAARDPLVPLGAPGTADDPAAGWSALVEWAAQARVEREAALPDAERAAATAGATADDAVRTADAAGAEVVARRREATAAARTEQQARGRVEALDERVTALRAALTGAPSPEQADAELARRDELEVVGPGRGRRSAPGPLGPLGGGRRGRRRPARGRRGLGGAAWRPRPARRARRAGGARRRSRGGLVGPRVVGAPGGGGAGRPAPGGGRRRGVRPQHATGRPLPAGRGAGGRGRGRRGRRSDRRRRAVGGRRRASADAAGEPAAVSGEAAVAAVASARAHAEAVRARLTERRVEAAGKRAAQAEAEETQHVARMLGGLLRSDRFPRWLVASALDTLVADASAGLAELSGGQFELTHDEGEFLVVDHADADARRPVKTLSGGETFQASLALALALSAQMSTLAAEGAARLDSIFLDEGFGTLDEANLDVVASTLENLAGRGDRMVGVITHVQSLAERVPVRFAVRRDQRSARIEREGS